MRLRWWPSSPFSSCVICVCVHMPCELPPKASARLTGNGKPTNKHAEKDDFLQHKRRFPQISFPRESRALIREGRCLIAPMLCRPFRETAGLCVCVCVRACACVCVSMHLEGSEFVTHTYTHSHRLCRRHPFPECLHCFPLKQCPHNQWHDLQSCIQTWPQCGHTHTHTHTHTPTEVKSNLTRCM